MTKIYLFGSANIFSIPKEIEDQLFNIFKDSNGQVKFIVGDGRGADSAYHKMLSAIGARSNSEIYSLDQVRNNNFDLATRKFVSEYDVETKTVTLKSPEGEVLESFTDVEKMDDIQYKREYYNFTNRQMIEDCDMAIALWDTESRGTFSNINTLKALDKTVYVFTYK